MSTVINILAIIIITTAFVFIALSIILLTWYYTETLLEIIKETKEKKIAKSSNNQDYDKRPIFEQLEEVFNKKGKK